MSDPVPFDPEQLPEFRAWAYSVAPPARPFSYMSEHLTTTTASIFLSMVFPKFTVKDGCILVDCLTSDESFQQWRDHLGGDHALIESSINRLVLWNWFDGDVGLEERAVEDMAEKIAFSWKACAGVAFPGRRFETWVTDDYGPTVVLCTTDRG